MEIDWFTVIAQVINFLVLVFLLKRFLYKPVLNAIDAREKRIAVQLNDAATKEADAVKERNLFQQKNVEFDEQRAAAMNKMAEEVKAERQKQLEQVRNDGVALQQKLERSIAEQQQNISAEIKNKIQQEVFAIADKALSDLGSVSLEEQIIQNFIQRINHLNDDERKQFSNAFNTSNKTLLITSAFILSDKQKDVLQKAVTSLINNDVAFNYQINPQLISGIQIAVNNYKLAWNIENYLNDLKKYMASSLSNTNNKENVAG
ncbi:MAG TPA: F0F1 ATP synthase subunit delta [Chitinophagaceae bacterium]|nr:F0F1 ATP synthase subunit delta [Chitinophagaceae bacterium]